MFKPIARISKFLQHCSFCLSILQYIIIFTLQQNYFQICI